MLLYHFPLTSDYSNRGYAKLYDANGNEKPLASLTTGFVSGGKISSNAKGTTTTLGTSYWNKRYNSYSIAIRAYRGNDANNIYGHLIVLHGGSTGKVDLNARFLNGNLKIGYYVTQSQVVITEIDVPATIGWHDIVMNFNSGTLKCYLDTNFIGSIDSISYDIVPYFFGNNFIGSNISTTTLIQDVRIYDRELSQAEINEYSRALVVHYPLQGNELNQSVLKDVSGFGNDRIFPDNSYYSTINASARGSASCRCGSKMLGLTNGTQPIGVKGKTMSVWVRQNFDSSSLSKWNALYLYRIKDGSISDFCYLSDGSGRSAIWFNKNLFGYEYVVGVWTHSAVVYDGSTCKIYKNGAIVSNKSLSLTDFNLDMIFAGNWNNITANNGVKDISDFRIYATALSAEDIKNLYNSPIAVNKQHQTMAFEFKENPLYPSKYWRTPTYAEMNYILNTRTNAANLRTLGRVEISSGVYRNGLFLLPDGFVAPSGITVTITTANYTTNSYTLAQFKQLESVGVVFLPDCSLRKGTALSGGGFYYISSVNANYHLEFYANDSNFGVAYYPTRNWGMGIRLICNGTKFSTSTTTKIDFAPANLQYHCTQHIWRFAEYSYDIIGADNANISDSYNGWIDLFGYGTSGVNYSPTLHSTNNSDYASGDIANTDNDWGINEIQSYDYNVKNFALNKNGIVQHNELIEGSADGCYQDKLITNELIEN